METDRASQTWTAVSAGWAEGCCVGRSQHPRGFARGPRSCCCVESLTGSSPGAALSLRTGGSGRPSHSSRILHETTLRSILQRCVLDSETLVGVFQVSGSSSFENQQSYLYQQLMDTDTSAGVSPPLSSKLCLHSSEPCLNMARPEL